MQCIILLILHLADAISMYAWNEARDYICLVSSLSFFNIAFLRLALHGSIFFIVGQNPALRSPRLSGPGMSSRPLGQNQQDPSSSDNGGEPRRRASRPFGSNIHTLRHDEDDFQSRDRNTFWNGNSTQYGGDDRR